MIDKAGNTKCNLALNQERDRVLKVKVKETPVGRRKLKSKVLHIVQIFCKKGGYVVPGTLQVFIWDISNVPE